MMKRLTALVLSLLLTGNLVKVYSADTSVLLQSEQFATELVHLSVEDEGSTAGKLIKNRSADAGTYRNYLDYYTMPGDQGKECSPTQYQNYALYISREDLPADGIIKDAANNITYKLSDDGYAVLRQYYTYSGNDITQTEKEYIGNVKKPCIDIEDGFYTNLYLLGASRGGEHDVSVKVVYTDSSSEEHLLKMNNFIAEGQFLIRPWTYYISNPSANSPGALGFNTYTLQTNSNKIVDKIQFAESKSQYLAEVFIAASGKKLTDDASKEMVQQNIDLFAGKTQISICDIAEIENVKRNLVFIGEENFNNVDKLKNAAAIYENKIANKEEFCIYVNSSAETGGDGTQNHPFKNIEQAKDAISAARSNGLETDAFPIGIIFSEGTYNFSDTVSFSAEDSGTEGCFISYRAAEGAEVVFSGAKELDSALFSKVTDKKILERLPEKVHGTILCTDLKAQGIENIPEYIANDDRDSKSDIVLFSNDREQPVAQWPNGEENYARSYEVVTEGEGTVVTGAVKGTGGSFVIPEEKAALWKNAGSDSYVTGNLSYLWSYNRVMVDSVDSENNILKLYSGVRYKLMDVAGGLRYKINHILEEIDSPGEWYADRENLVLYYYPAGDISTQKLELAINDKNLIELDNCSFVSFSGISFEKNRSGAIYSKKGSEKIEIIGCDFQNIAGTAVHFDSERTGTLGDKRVNGAFDCSISENDFEYIGAAAVTISGSGYLDNLTKGNNLIADNYIYKASQKTHRSAVWLQHGIGCTVENNIIHNIPMYGITFEGTDHAIKNNEIYNAGREGSDVGAIYTCYGILMPGTEIAYNYLHDIKPVTSSLSLLHKGIYLDGSASGNNIHHNILYNTTDGVFANGRDNIINGNVIVDSEIASLFGLAETAGMQDYESVAKVHLQGLADSEYKELWIENYPKLEEVLKDIDTNPGAANNKITNNVHDGVISLTDEYSASMDSGNYSANTRIDMSSSSLFADPSKQDFRIKDEDVISKSPEVISTDYSIDNIGLKKDIVKFSLRDEDFAPIFPVNNQTIYGDDELIFSWEDAAGADLYEIIIATDEEFENIVYRKTTSTCYADVRDFDFNTTKYYWNIRAINNSRQLSGERYSTNGSYSFSFSDITLVTNEYVPIDIKDYCNVKLLTKKGEKDSSYSNGDYWNKRGLNQSLLEKQLNEDRELYVEDVKYKFTQLENTYKAINPRYSDSDIVINLPEDKYEAIHFLGNYGSRSETAPLVVKIIYTDDTSEEITVGKVYSAHQIAVPMAPRLTLSWVLAESGEIWTDMYCQMNSYNVSPTKDCAVKQLVFKKMDDTTTNLQSLGIFAVTAQLKSGQRGENALIRVKNNVNRALPYMLIKCSKTDDGTLKNAVITKGNLTENANGEPIYFDNSTEDTSSINSELFLWSDELKPYLKKLTLK